MDTYNIEMSILNDELKIDMIMNEMTLFNNTILNENNTVLTEGVIENIKNKFIKILEKIVEKIKEIISWVKEKIFKKIDESENKIKQDINNIKSDENEMIRHCESRFPNKTATYDYFYNKYFSPIAHIMSTASKWKNKQIDDEEMEDNIDFLQIIIEELKRYQNDIKNKTDDTAIVREYNNRKRKDIIDDITKINKDIKSNSKKLNDNLNTTKTISEQYKIALKNNKNIGSSDFKMYTEYLNLSLQAFSLLINTIEWQIKTAYGFYMYNNMILTSLVSGSDMEGEKFEYLYDN